jgi:sugar (pentulose or hexulose) kinase
LYAGLNEQALLSPPGARGLIFLAPRRRPGADGHLSGLTLSHTAGDVGRALMEGIACDLGLMAAEMRAAGMRLESLIMTGGATRSSVWPTIVADILGLPLRIPEMAEAGARGGAILAGAGSGVYPDVPTAMATFALPGRELRPDPANRACYDDLMGRYQRLDRCLEPEVSAAA